MEKLYQKTNEFVPQIYLPIFQPVSLFDSVLTSVASTCDLSPVLPMHRSFTDLHLPCNNLSPVSQERQLAHLATLQNFPKTFKVESVSVFDFVGRRLP